jgi:hypothetical protein
MTTFLRLSPSYQPLSDTYQPLQADRNRDIVIVGRGSPKGVVMSRRVLGLLVMVLLLTGCDSGNGPYCHGWPEVQRPDGTWGESCPEGTYCFDGRCVEMQLEECGAAPFDWELPALGLEPNGRPEMATILPCGDDGVTVDPAEYAERCPNRVNYQNGFNHLLICPNPERDMFRIYLLPDEAVFFSLLYQYVSDKPRDLDLAVWRLDPATDEPIQVALADSVTDNEEITVTTDATSGNPAGWYYAEVFGKTVEDVSYYAIAFTLNPL